MKIGLDVGSTTIKAVVLDEHSRMIYKTYERHYSQIMQKTIELLERLTDELGLAGSYVPLAITGSAGMGMAERAGIPFVQEVYATRAAAMRLLPGTDVIIELGGEDAKILFLTGGEEVRMNGSCAGGTGAFIDQMATLMDMPLDTMNDMARSHTRVHTVASRCVVFANSDIQPLLNQGAKKEDIAASIFSAVVNQTVGGLAQGRPIKGSVVYLGGPLTFLSELRRSFDSTLGLTGHCPEDSLYFVAMGAAFTAAEEVCPTVAIDSLKNYVAHDGYHALPALFDSEADYAAFTERHSRAGVLQKDPTGYTGRAYLGVDAGSTTVKMVLTDEGGDILFSDYRPNLGNPVPIIAEFLRGIYSGHPGIEIAASAVTGYGEELVKNVFDIDYGVVETVAHFTAARRFLPEVDFIIDIGGQDIKCFKIRGGAVDNIFLNEACSSGCGSFLQTFANALGYSIEDFAKLGTYARRPVDLGSRCTVFMNSSVKQAQKDGASIEDISAGLSISVVKNALYKVIRATSPSQLGKNIVVQGGTFYNDAVLRAFEQELGVEVVRPSTAGLMGAYGAALYAAGRAARGAAAGRAAPTGAIPCEELDNITPATRTANCELCSNNCLLTIHTYSSGGPGAKPRRYISGNRCERPVSGKVADESLNLYEYKRCLLAGYTPQPGSRGTIGIPLGLNNYEMLPFWHAFFGELGFSVVASPFSNREIYLSGQASMPSDTVCFPAKLMHGHIEWLLAQGVDAIFYPCMSYNFDEGLGDNHYNCPVVAYYPEVLDANLAALRDTTYIFDFLGPHVERQFPQKALAVLSQYFGGLDISMLRRAAQKGHAERESYLAAVRAEGDKIIAAARAKNIPIVVLAGRPYHIDPEINHGLDKLVASFGVAAISEEALSHLVPKTQRGVLDQWTYHSRLYAAAQYVTGQPDMNLVQLVSFGCGVDAITSDETRAILERGGKIYTQIKIDEIENLGAVKIRLRSLFAAIEEIERGAPSADAKHA